jgi:hypothetical protein
MKIYENKLLVSSLKNKQQSVWAKTRHSATGARISHPAAAGGVVESS